MEYNTGLPFLSGNHCSYTAFAWELRKKIIEKYPDLKAKERPYDFLSLTGDGADCAQNLVMDVPTRLDECACYFVVVHVLETDDNGNPVIVVTTSLAKWAAPEESERDAVERVGDMGEATALLVSSVMEAQLLCLYHLLYHEGDTLTKANTHLKKELESLGMPWPLYSAPDEDAKLTPAECMSLVPQLAADVTRLKTVADILYTNSKWNDEAIERRAYESDIKLLNKRMDKIESMLNAVLLPLQSLATQLQHNMQAITKE